MKRYNIPVRTPAAIKAELLKAAQDEGLKLTEYLERLATAERLAVLARRRDLTGNAYVTPRLEAASRVRDTAKAIGCRQWEAWLALHRIKVEEGGEG
jgi:hypothetical protein